MNGNELSIDLLRDIICHELELNDDRVNIYNGKFNIPTDNKLFVYLEPRATTVYSTGYETYEDAQGNLVEETRLNSQERIIVGVFSRNLEALQRKEEVVLALNSNYSQTLQEQNNFHIARIAKIEALSMLEATALLFRFDIPVTILSYYSKVRVIQYFDTNLVHVTVNDGLPNLTSDFTQKRQL